MAFHGSSKKPSALAGAPRYLLVNECAEVARTSVATVYDWLSRGVLKSSKPGRRRLILESDLLEFLSGGAKGGGK